MYSRKTKSMVFLLMAISSEKNRLKVKTILVVIKFCFFRFFPKPVQINPNRDNIRAKSNNGYIYHRGY